MVLSACYMLTFLYLSGKHRNNLAKIIIRQYKKNFVA